jgi:hypothetical protein
MCGYDGCNEPVTFGYHRTCFSHYCYLCVYSNAVETASIGPALHSITGFDPAHIEFAKRKSACPVRIRKCEMLITSPYCDKFYNSYQSPIPHGCRACQALNVCHYEGCDQVIHDLNLKSCKEHTSVCQNKLCTNKFLQHYARSSDANPEYFAQIVASLCPDCDAKQLSHCFMCKRTYKFDDYVRGICHMCKFKSAKQLDVLVAVPYHINFMRNEFYFDLNCDGTYAAILTVYHIRFRLGHIKPPDHRPDDLYNLIYRTIALPKDLFAVIKKYIYKQPGWIPLRDYAHEQLKITIK